MYWFIKLVKWPKILNSIFNVRNHLNLPDFSIKENLFFYHDIYLILQILKRLASIWNVFESFRDLGEIFILVSLTTFALAAVYWWMQFHQRWIYVTFTSVTCYRLSSHYLPAAYRITQKCCIQRIWHNLIKNQMIL